MRYDCSNILDFKHEKERMCEMTNSCDNCCLGHTQKLRETLCGLQCDRLPNITENEINILQKWSDEHPQKTRAEALLEKIPMFKMVYNNRPAVCWATVIGKEADCEDLECRDCWKMPYNGEFEEVRINHEKI